MTGEGTLKVFAQGDLEIVMVREFNAPPRLVFEAFAQPALLKRWLYGLDGWELAVCEMDLRAGGKYRWVWRNVADGTEMGAGGVIREFLAPERIVMTERYDDPWYEGEAVNTITFTGKGGRTTMTTTLRHTTKATRDAVLQSPMESGVKLSYDRLAGVLAELQTAPGRPGTRA
jgi:uncharacterized protein YndB with AHSA1/START domain